MNRKAVNSVAGQLLICDRKGKASLAEGIVEISDGRIVAVEYGDIDRAAELGDRETLICPGFIDTHLHFPQFDSIGAHGLKLLDWLEQVIFPAEIKWADRMWACKMTERVISQCLSVGTTGICAYATSHAESTKVAIDRVSRSGMRGVIGHVLMDRNAPRELCGQTDELVDQTEELISRHPPVHRVAAAITPRFALSCTEELMQQAGQIAKRNNVIVQTHLAETESECSLVSAAFDGKRYVDIYDEFGLLGQKTILGHGIYLDDSDRAKIAERGSIIAHCPLANSFLMSGTMNRAAHLSAGVRVTLGSDVGAGYERSMIRVARSMIESAAFIAQRTGQFDCLPTAADGWYKITAGNADELGWADAGRIEIGASADLLVIQPDIPWRDPAVDPLSRLMFSWDDRWLSHTILQGCIA